MIHILDKSKCTGCEACVNICPFDAIQMHSDDEGFLYPKVDMARCVDCGLCEKRCPVLAPREIKEDTKAVAVQYTDDRIRAASSSGGAFTAIANAVVQNGGIVYGAAYDDAFGVAHIGVKSEEEVARFRGSKYVQSSIGSVYTDIKSVLNAGEKVCFSGTPCQIEGLLAYLGKAYDNLVTVDIVCHGVPSPKLYRKYLDYQIRKYGPISAVAFRDKCYGYAGSTMSLKFKSGKKITNTRELQFFKDAFFRNLSTRPSCYSCKFKTVERRSDFTIFDCWNIGRWDRMMDDDKGTTLVLLHTQKAKDFFEQIKPKLRYCSVSVNEAIEVDGDMAVKSIPNNPLRTAFFEDMNRMDIPSLMEKYVPQTFLRRLVMMFKPMIYRMNLLPLLKRLLH